MRNPHSLGSMDAVEFDQDEGERKREDRIQRELDDAREVQIALFEGREAARQCRAPGLNRYEIGTPQADAWERGRREEEGRLRQIKLKKSFNAARASNDHATAASGDARAPGGTNSRRTA